MPKMLEIVSRYCVQLVNIPRIVTGKRCVQLSTHRIDFVTEAVYMSKSLVQLPRFSYPQSAALSTATITKSILFVSMFSPLSTAPIITITILKKGI